MFFIFGNGIEMWGDVWYNRGVRITVFGRIVMLTIKEAKKIPYEQIDSETEGYIYDLFRKYVVRKQIADANKELTSVFARKLRTTNPRDYAACFNTFNSAFVNANLIGQLSYDEIHTNYLKDMSEDKFNWFLNQPYNTFERKVALMCFSQRPSERIANRADFSVMVAYANMQQRVMEYVKKYPKATIDQIINQAAKEVRAEHVDATGKKINDTEIAEQRTDYKGLGKKAAPLWRSMIASYKSRLQDYRSIEAAHFVLENFVYTDVDKKMFFDIYDRAMSEACREVQSARNLAEQQAEEMPEYYDVSDYDEVYSTRYAEEVYFEIIEKAMGAIFAKYLADPIYEEKKKD